MKQIKYFFGILLLLVLSGSLTAQQRNYNPKPMNLNVGRFQLSMNTLNGDGGLQSQYSWNLTGTNASKTEIFYWPQDQWQSNMLYQIFNPVVLDNNGILDEFGNKQIMIRNGETLTNPGKTDWTMETRRYRPPVIIVDGVNLTPPYRGYVDRNLKTDIKIEFEDVLSQFGIRSHVELMAFSNPELSDFFIWKATHKFTGEVVLPRYANSSLDTLPDQTIRFWWPISFSFGPSKAGERSILFGFGVEGEDDYDSWIMSRSKFTGNNARDTLIVAYYRDGDSPSAAAYSNGLTDDTGDPDRTTGFLHSPQVCGFTLLHADKSASDRSNDKTQPYSAAHAGITKDLWGKRGPILKDLYLGTTTGRWTVEPPTSSGAYDKGPMRFITSGPYELTKNKAQNRYDSLTFVYAVGAGSIGYEMADSIGKGWFKKEISNEVKNQWVLKGRDSLLQNLDRANWAWGTLSKGGVVPAAPPAPDINVQSGVSSISVSWSYEDSTYFIDPFTNRNDFYAWRIYRKMGNFYVNDPNDANSGYRWDLIAEIKDRNVRSFIDTAVSRGGDYYYAVTAVDDGIDNINPEHPQGLKLESSRYINRSTLPATPFRQGLSQSDGDDKIRVVPNPYVHDDVRGVGLHQGTKNRLKFYNLPNSCTLKIYTETGDLVTTIDHKLGDREFWDQKTKDNQYVASGIYLLVATDAIGHDGKPMKDQIAKFVIIR